MNILYIIFHGFEPNNGISKKISYQIKALEELGHQVHICYMDETNSKKRKVNETVIADYGKGLLSKIYKRIKFSSIVDFAKDNHINFVYIRSNHNANPFTINMVRQMKRLGMNVVMEIPTFPYDSEYTNKHLKRQLIQDKLFRNSFAQHLDAIVTFSNDDFIFGQRTIKISNGIDFNSIPLKENTNCTSHELNLIGVAEIHGWHGYDRVVKGLAEYYSKPQAYIVRFHIVGYFFSREEEEYIKDFIHKFNMENYVILYGKKHGEELDKIFDKCDFGIGSLGRHRVGIKHIKTLKNREYAARGIAFTYSETDSDFDDMPYVLKMPADETPVNISKIISFYQELTLTPYEIRNSISNLSWKHQMELVLQGVFPMKRGKRHIAYCIPSLDRPSGMERVLTTKANYLTNYYGYDITIILTDNKDTKPYFTLSPDIKIIQLDINIDNLWMYPIRKRIYLYLKKQREYRQKLEICLKTIKPDITISLLRREINFLSDLKDGSKKIGEIHFGRFKYREAHFSFLPKFANQCISALWMKQLDQKVRKLDRFVVLTYEDANNWKECNNISVISNPITIHSNKLSSCSSKQVIAVGRYTYQKGFDILIEAWKYVNHHHPDWSLHIFGAGDKTSYEQLAIRHQVANSVFCHEATNNIVDEYLKSSIFAFSSRFEGFGLVLAEAMSVGVPCVSFTCPCGPKDIILDGEDGILCPNGDKKALAEGICRLIEDKALRLKMSHNAIHNIKRYQLDSVMTQWHQLFTQIIHPSSII